jgi:GpV Apex motif
VNIDGPVNVNGNVSVTGDILATGDIRDLNGTHGGLNTLRQAYDVHTHPGVQNGSGSTGTTSNPV